jgi:guanosine-3',5'-bis(diphosphate) 3'-pyrophosphohydrolase
MNLIGEIESAAFREASPNTASRRTVKGRRKRPFSIWKKMERKSVGFEQLSDLFGFRIIVQHGRGVLPRARHRPHHLAGRARPLQGLHFDAEAERLSLAPHDRDRTGQAARRAADPHAGDGRTRRIRHRRPCALQGRRRLGAEQLAPESRAYGWLRHTIEVLSEGSNPEEFLEHTKLELFHDQVFCFTPKGKLIALPRKANAIDFAYAVHTDVGASAVGCKINGKFAPLSSELQNGDEVEIITSPAQAAPPPAWEQLAVTGKARAAISRATRRRFVISMPVSAAAWSSACFSAPRSNMPTTS